MFKMHTTTTTNNNNKNNNNNNSKRQIEDIVPLLIVNKNTIVFESDEYCNY